MTDAAITARPIPGSRWLS